MLWMGSAEPESGLLDDRPYLAKNALRTLRPVYFT
jgi:hypothetical protein